ncbi:MAG TPA: S46 family peptidase, partial [Bacteroidales bacterium]|nr:S46 family peptidase [Bacteroidales bacterium]
MKKTIFFLTFFLLSLIVHAGEGMWLPILLQQPNEKEMRAMGMRITADDIYSINHSSLKDAIVLFGGGCTGEIVSGQGLLLTNHHCGYGNIQRHSSLEHDYLTDGFWAQSFAEELPNPGLSVTFLVRMQDVTTSALNNVTPRMNESQRDSVIAANSKIIVNEAVKGTHYKASVRPFFAGNQYYLLVTETFNDIRLVGAPPSNIGKFGGDTDNWMWPRHTGDFSVFR